MPIINAAQEAKTEKETPTTNIISAFFASKAPSYSRYLDYLNNDQLVELNQNFLDDTPSDPANSRKELFEGISEIAKSKKYNKPTSRNLEKMFTQLTQYTEKPNALELFVKSCTKFFLRLNAQQIITVLNFVSKMKNDNARYVIISTLFKNKHIATRYLGYTAPWDANRDVSVEEMTSYRSENKKLFVDVFTAILTSNCSKMISALFENFDSYYYVDKNVPNGLICKVQVIIQKNNINIDNLALSPIAKQRLNYIMTYPKQSSHALAAAIDSKANKAKRLVAENSDVSLTVFIKEKVVLQDQQILALLEYLCDLFNTDNNNNNNNNNKEKSFDFEIQKKVWADLFNNKHFTQKAFGYTAPNDLITEFNEKFYNREMFVATITLIMKSKSSPAISALIEAMDIAYERRVPESLSRIVKDIIVDAQLTISDIKLSDQAKWQWDLICYGAIQEAEFTNTMAMKK